MIIQCDVKARDLSKKMGQKDVSVEISCQGLTADTFHCRYKRRCSFVAHAEVLDGFICQASGKKSGGPEKLEKIMIFAKTKKRRGATLLTGTTRPSRGGDFPAISRLEK